MEKLKKPANALDLAEIDAAEARLESAKAKTQEFQPRGLLEGFK